VPAPPLGLTLEPARPVELLLGLLVPAAPGAADGCCIVLPGAPDCPEAEGAAPELVPPAPAFILQVKLMNLSSYCRVKHRLRICSEQRKWNPQQTNRN